MGTLRVIDAASHQGNMNQKAMDFDALIVKATEGTGYINPYCDSEFQEAMKLGKKLGVYHFARNTLNSAEAEANYFIKHTKGYIGKAIPVLDWEDKNTSDVTWALKWLQLVEKAYGCKPLIYMSEAVVNAYNWSSVVKGDYGLWVAKYADYIPDYNFNMAGAGKAPSVKWWRTIALWQWTSVGRLNGHNGNLDCSVFYGDASTWDKYLGKSTSSGSTTKPVNPDGEVKDNAGVFQSKKDQTGEVAYQGHLRQYGWANWQCDGAMIGSTGQNRRMEALRIDPVNHMDVAVHIKDIGDKVYRNITKDTIIGTIGQELRLEALKIMSGDTVYLYRVHQKDIGWSNWCVNGQWAGQKGKSLQIEAVEIKVADIAYLAHVQDSGDTIWAADGMTAGTTGQDKRMEALRIKSQHCGDVYAKAHIQGIGWKDFGKIDQNTVIGTEGDGLRLECLCLKGDFEWRAHIQGTGWTQWTKADGVATLGTVGESLRMEAVEMRAAA